MSTATRVDSQVMGALHVDFYTIDLTGSDTSIAIKTGGNNAVFAAYTPNTSDDHGLIHLNYSDAGTTVALGTIFLSAVTAADNGYLVVFYK